MSAYADLIERLVEGKPSYIDPVARELWNRDGFAARDAISRLEREKAELQTLLGALQFAEADYRATHDLYGGGSRESGRAWDLMRRAGDKARALLSRTQEQRQ